MPYIVIILLEQISWKALMNIIIDFNSDEALYMQLRNQIIMGIATSQLKEGQSLPSVRVMAEDIGINMHTVNKAYTILREDGFLRVDRRRGAVISLDIDKLKACADINEQIRPLIAQAAAAGISKEEVLGIVGSLYDEIENEK